MGDLAWCGQGVDDRANIRALPVRLAGCKGRTALTRGRLPTGLGGSQYPQWPRRSPAVTQRKVLRAAALAVYPRWSDSRVCTSQVLTKRPCVSRS